MWQQISNSREGVCFQWLEASLSEHLASPSVENLQDFSNLARSRPAFDWLSSKQIQASGLLLKTEEIENVLAGRRKRSAFVLTLRLCSVNVNVAS